jgi:hypothetical protein
MVIITSQQIAQFRSQLAEHPEALKALDATEYIRKLVRRIGQKMPRCYLQIRG